MEKKLLLITADYFPYPSSNTNCLDPLLKGLERNGWQIDLITRRMCEDSLPFEREAGGRRIWRVDDVRSMHTIRVNEKLKGKHTPLSKYSYKGYAVASKGWNYLRFCIGNKEPRFAGWRKDEVQSKGMELLENETYTAMLSVSHPVITHEIVMELKKRIKKAVPWYVYDYDPFCYNESQYGKGCAKKLMPQQHEIYRTCDGIFLGPELYAFYLHTPFACYQDKMHVFPFANMHEIPRREENAERGLIDFQEQILQCVYAGAIAEDIRNPLYAIKVMERVAEECFRFYLITGSKTEFLESALGSEYRKFVLLPPQSREVSYDCLQRADFLVNIGNTVPFQVPGKIFEYMAIGKPIIHFCKMDSDPCLRYLQNYPYKLVIEEKEQTPQKHARQILDFCKENRGKQIAFDALKRAMPEYIGENVVHRFVAKFNDLNGIKMNEKK